MTVMEQFPSSLPEENNASYYHDCLTKIMAGETVWMQRNFDSDFGRVVDLYHDNKHIGFIEEEYGYGCDVYEIQGSRTDDSLEYISLTQYPVDLEESSQILLARIEK